MKALSIIGIVLSVFLIGTSPIMASPSSMNNCSDFGIRLLFHFLLGLFFLAFSIVAVVRSFKKQPH